MPFEWRAFIDLARTLQQQAQGANREALLRTALSRAYYGAFGYARGYAQLWLKYEPLGTEEDHRMLRQLFWARKRQNVARSLDQLRRWRNQADYDNDLSIDLEASVPSALGEANRIVAALPPPKPKRPPTP